MRILALLLMTSGMAAGLLRPSTLPASAARFADAPVAEEPPLLTWRDLTDRPCRWLGRTVRVRLQFESWPAAWNPYLTRFGTGQFVALQGFADEQLPWVTSDFDTPQARVFLRTGSDAQRALGGAVSYARFELTGVVREVFLDLPWIEVIRTDPMSEAISEATTIHAARALELMGEGAWHLAELELEQALAAPLPEAAAAELGRLRDECQAAQPASAVKAAAPRR